MGRKIEPRQLSESGERCILSLNALLGYALPPQQLLISGLAPVEAHVSRMVGRLIDESPIRGNIFAESMINTLADDFVDNWDQRMSWLSKGFGVSITGEHTYQKLQRVNAARNAIIHNEGSLTDRQLGKLNQLIQLRKNLKADLDIVCSGRKLVFSPTTGDLAISILRDFTVHLDALVIAKYPAARRM